ncbi:MAG: T9SS type A sorting domain-containing protein [candidate division WOR-3 bacterium]|nr:MAG: T9SS type A sorting domain-containing protein [candidate division WOR-3 bacterium]
MYLLVSIIIVVFPGNWFDGEELAVEFNNIQTQSHSEYFPPALAITGGRYYDSLNVRLVGNWPFGAAHAVTADSTRNLIFCGSGGGVYIYDVTTPSNPITLSEAIHTAGCVRGFFYDSSTQVLLIAAQSAGIELWDVSNPLAPDRLGSCMTPPHSLGVTAFGTYAYIANGDSGLYIMNISDPTNPYEIGHHPAFFVVDIDIAWPYVYLLQSDGDIGGLRVINVSDPTNPQEVAWCHIPGGAVHMQIVDTLIYVASYFMDLTVISVANPLNPSIIGSCYILSTGLGYDVDVKGDYAYLADDAGGLRVIDISNASNPVEIGYYINPEHAWAIEVLGSYAYVVDNRVGLWVIEISDPANPQGVRCDTLPDYAMKVAISDTFAYLANNHGGLRIIDISGLYAPAEIEDYSSPGYAYGVAVTDTLAYVADHWSGLRIINVTDPANPFEVGSYDTPGEARNVIIMGIYAYVADWTCGLRIIDISNPSSCYEIGSYDTPGSACNLAINDTIVFIADRDAGLRIINTSDPSYPVEIGVYDTPGIVLDVAVSDSYAYLTDWYYGMKIINVSDPSNPYQVGYYSPQDYYAYGATLSGYHVYLTGARSFTDDWGLNIIDVSDPTNPAQVGHYFNPSIAYPYDVTISNGYIYVTARESGLQIYEFFGAEIEQDRRDIQPGNFVQINNPVKRWLHLVINHSGFVSIELFDAQGRKIKKILDGTINGPRLHSVDLATLSSGVYFVQLETSSYKEVKKVILVK